MRPVEIVGANAARATNQGHYRLYLEKWAQRPTGVEEIVGTREVASATDQQQTRMYKVPWSVRHAFREWALGYSYSELIPGALAELRAIAELRNDLQLVPNPNDPPPITTRLRRIIPAQDPERPWLFAASCDLIDTQGAWIEEPSLTLRPEDIADFLPETALRDRFGSNVPTSGAIAYVDNSLGGSAGEEPGPFEAQLGLADPRRFRDGYGTYRVVYTPRRFRVATDGEVSALPGGELRRYVTRGREFGLEALPLARLVSGGIKQLRFAEGAAGIIGQVIPEAGVKQLPTATLTYTWHDVPELPWDAYHRCLGRVNANTFDGHRGSPKYPAGTLLCLPWKDQETVSATGRVTWTVTFRFAWRANKAADGTPQGWNYLPAADGNFYLATFTTSTAGDPDGEKIYKTADFAELFVAPPPEDYR